MERSAAVASIDVSPSGCAGTWVQGDGILSALLPAESLGSFRAVPPALREQTVLAELAAVFGPSAGAPTTTFVRDWGADPWTQGYVAAWRPGELTAVGPLHGTHEPPFWVPAPTTGCAGTWRARSAPGARPPLR